MLRTLVVMANINDLAGIISVESRPTEDPRAVDNLFEILVNLAASSNNHDSLG